MATTLRFPDNVRPDFEGFGDEAFFFLWTLQANNERAWFKANKEIYDHEVKFPMECLLGEFTRERRPAGFPLVGDPGRGMFRIYRDVRFSSDKSPYKTHAGAVMTRTGAKGEPGLVYVHIQPGQSFISAGFYAPDRHFLQALRTRIAAHPAQFLQLVAPFTDGQGDYEFGHRGALRSMPRGFGRYADTEVASYLKWRHFLLTRTVSDHEAQHKGLLTMIAELGISAAPFLEFGWDVLASSLDDDPRRHMRQGR